MNGGLGIVLEETEDKDHDNLLHHLHHHHQHQHHSTILSNTEINSLHSSYTNIVNLNSSPLPSSPIFTTTSGTSTATENKSSIMSSPKLNNSISSSDIPISIMASAMVAEKEMKFAEELQREEDQKQQTSKDDISSNIEGESLLPPLPTAPEDLINNERIPSVVSDDNHSSSHSRSSTIDSKDDFNQIFIPNTSNFSNYVFDSLDHQNPPQDFPILTANLMNSAQSSMNSNNNISNNNNNNTNSSTATNNSNNNSSSSSSPLRKLRSLKNGIRKLSLSTHSNNNSITSSTTPSTTPTSATPATSRLSSVNIPNLAPSTPVENTGKHSHSSSTSSNSSFSQSSSKNNRIRGLSHSTTATPPLASPVITISENLSNSKRTLNNIEQNYFDSLNQKYEIHSIEELTNIDDLLNYSNFLNQQKSSLDDVFKLAKQRLVDSGWCSEHDLNNLQLQHDSSRCQIDTLLLKIEEKLNREYSISLLGNRIISNNNTTPAGKLTTPSSSAGSIPTSRSIQLDEKSLGISPSLKVLESRCLAFPEF
ncbi:uncharacterized protein J8A68_002821 [[Candida] subhashii]|uniref:Uncharacterized protein n=1 Tax=[Candida] subhashii TaxID=561895 RepID=A0A8J5UNC3_9ASCO|nr:uncharacterized protein J8A68_002821 [[Candida] subhashii]KAG7663572.1 hypothetical protein J8A68_002821 [[Candida] subhashii]